MSNLGGITLVPEADEIQIERGATGLASAPTTTSVLAITYTTNANSDGNIDLQTGGATALGALDVTAAMSATTVTTSTTQAQGSREQSGDRRQSEVQFEELGASTEKGAKKKHKKVEIDACQPPYY